MPGPASTRSLVCSLIAIELQLKRLANTQHIKKSGEVRVLATSVSVKYLNNIFPRVLLRGKVRQCSGLSISALWQYAVYIHSVMCNVLSF